MYLETCLKEKAKQYLASLSGDRSVSPEFSLVRTPRNAGDTSPKVLKSLSGVA
jgi:hypothetical protein